MFKIREGVQAWVVAMKIEIVGSVIADHVEVKDARANGTELCEEEIAALRAGVVAGLAAAHEIATGDNNEDLDAVVAKTLNAAVHAYGLYLKEAENA